MNVIQFPHAQAPIQPIGHFIRLGETGYQKLGNLHAAGRLPASRVVADASRIKHQRELIGALKATGCEIILDTKAAELSAREKVNGMARHAPWSTLGNGSPLNPTHAAYQAFSAVEELAKIPDLSRSKHFLDGKMRNVDQQSRAIKDLKFSAEDAKALKIDAEQLTNRLIENSKKIGKMRSTLEHLHELRADGAPRARPLARRVIGRTQTAFVKK